MIITNKKKKPYDAIYNLLLKEQQFVLGYYDNSTWYGDGYFAFRSEIDLFNPALKTEEGIKSASKVIKNIIESNQNVAEKLTITPILNKFATFTTIKLIRDNDIEIWVNEKYLKLFDNCNFYGKTNSPILVANSALQIIGIIMPWKLKE